MRTVTSSSLLGFLLLAACSAGNDDDPANADMAPPVEGRPVSAADFCDELAALVCDANTRCCGGVVDVGSDPDDAETCEEQQLAACRGSVEPLLEDPRTAYVPERGGAFLDAFEVQAEGCFAAPPSVDDFMALFEGTGVEGADCTPPSTDTDDLRVSQLSCADGLACHLYARSTGGIRGTCEPREDMDCSHVLDCASGYYCNQPEGWEPGRWGSCQPLKTNAWECTSDQQCESRYCSPVSGQCADPEPQRYCAARTYGGLVVAHEPLGYWRLGEGSGTAAATVGAGFDGEYTGGTTLVEGIAGDDDGAVSIGGMNRGVILPEAVGESFSGRRMTLELWFQRSGSSETGPLLEFGQDDEEAGRGVRIWNHNAADKLHANFRDVDGTGHSTTSAEGTIEADTWYHVVATYDGSTGRLYLDGSTVGEPIEGSFEPQTTGELFVGLRMDDERSVQGSVDEVAVYDRVLSSGEIRAHRDRGKDGPAAQDFVLFRWLR
ncbi:MAG: hypothetical protein CMN30_18090 [Sandaracinus sp.]|nr:hypothetical protein [Sandaracinus sp.]